MDYKIPLNILSHYCFATTKFDPSTDVNFGGNLESPFPTLLKRNILRYRELE